MFFAFFVFLLFIFSNILIPKNNDAKSGIIQVGSHGFLGEKENSLDVLYIGDSESYSSFSPMQMYEEYGITGYVTGVSAQRIYNQYYYLKEALEKQSPKVVVVETNTLFRKYSVANAVVGELNNTVPFVKYHDRWKNISLRDLNFKKDYTHREVTKGFQIRKMIDSVEKTDYMKKSDKITEVPYLNEYYVKKIKELCEKKGAQVLLVSSKTLRNMNYGRHAGLQRMADRLELPYLDLNMIPEIDIDWKTDTVDQGDHLNTAGAIKVSSYMGEYLVKNYNLKSHKNDPYYADWNNDLVEYKKLIG